MDIWEDYPRFKRLVGLGVLAVALVLVGITAWQFALDASLWVLGRQTEAVIVDSWVEIIESVAVEGKEDVTELSFRYWLTYEFVTPQGRTFGRDTTVGAGEWVTVPSSDAGSGAVEDAPTVTVVYFPLYPAHNRLDQSRYVPLLACGYVPLALLAGVALLVGWRMVWPARETGLQVVSSKQQVASGR